MHLRRIVRYLAIALRASKAAAFACNTSLLVDNFSGFSHHKNNLGLKASDDGSMKSISAAKHTISFTPQESSYFYEAVPCFSRKTIGYGAIAFVIKAPQDASITLEMQTAQQEHDCSGETYSSTWRYVANFTGQVQRVIAPFSSFVGAKAEDIFAFNWATWQTQDTGFVWEMGDIELICGEEDEAGV